MKGGILGFCRSIATGLAAVAATLVVARDHAAEQDAHPARSSRLRRPVAAALLDGGRTVCVANAGTGTLSVVDMAAGRVVEELSVGQRLVDLAAAPGTPYLLAVDEAAAQVVVLGERQGRLAVRARANVCRSPVSVSIAPDAKTATVAGLWSHQLDVLDFAGPADAVPAVRVRHSIELPFAPRMQAWLPRSDRVVVADSFGGRLAVVDVERGRVVATHELAGHNIRGMALSADGADLFVSHQILDQHALINWQTIHSGTLMANIVRRIPVERLVDAKADLDADSERIPVGMTGHGGGDPSGIALLDGDRIAVCLSGFAEVVVLNKQRVITGRVDVGRRPTRLVALPGSSQLLAVNTHSDSISLVNPDTARVTRTISLGPGRPLTAAERGEAAFYDARLSHDGWLSCHSCHTDGHTNGLRADTQSDGTDGAPKRVLSLLGSAHTNRWAWDGSVEDLYDQVRRSMLTTMLSDGVDAGTAADLVAYLESLPPAPARQPAGNAADRAQIARGRQVFLDHACQQCHVPPLTYTSSDAFDVGLEDERGRRRFNPPSLRGVGHGTRFFHDNRATSLESVFRDHAHPSDTSLTDDDLADLVRFLKSL